MASQPTNQRLVVRVPLGLLDLGSHVRPVSAQRVVGIRCWLLTGQNDGTPKWDELRTTLSRCPMGVLMNNFDLDLPMPVGRAMLSSALEQDDPNYYVVQPAGTTAAVESQLWTPKTGVEYRKRHVADGAHRLTFLSSLLEDKGCPAWLTANTLIAYEIGEALPTTFATRALAFRENLKIMRVADPLAAEVYCAEMVMGDAVVEAVISARHRRAEEDAAGNADNVTDDVRTVQRALDVLRGVGEGRMCTEVETAVDSVIASMGALGLLKDSTRPAGNVYRGLDVMTLLRDESCDGELVRVLLIAVNDALAAVRITVVQAYALCLRIDGNDQFFKDLDTAKALVAKKSAVAGRKRPDHGPLLSNIKAIQSQLLNVVRSESSLGYNATITGTTYGGYDRTAGGGCGSTNAVRERTAANGMWPLPERLSLAYTSALAIRRGVVCPGKPFAPSHAEAALALICDAAVRVTQTDTSDRDAYDLSRSHLADIFTAANKAGLPPGNVGRGSRRLYTHTEDDELAALEDKCMTSWVHGILISHFHLWKMKGVMESARREGDGTRAGKSKPRKVGDALVTSLRGLCDAASDIITVFNSFAVELGYLSLYDAVAPWIAQGHFRVSEDGVDVLRDDLPAPPVDSGGSYYRTRVPLPTVTDMPNQYAPAALVLSFLEDRTFDTNEGVVRAAAPPRANVSRVGNWKDSVGAYLASKRKQPEADQAKQERVLADLLITSLRLCFGLTRQSGVPCDMTRGMVNTASGIVPMVENGKLVHGRKVDGCDVGLRYIAKTLEDTWKHRVGAAKANVARILYEPQDTRNTGRSTVHARSSDRVSRSPAHARSLARAVQVRQHTLRASSGSLVDTEGDKDVRNNAEDSCADRICRSMEGDANDDMEGDANDDEMCDVGGDNGGATDVERSDGAAMGVNSDEDALDSADDADATTTESGEGNEAMTFDGDGAAVQAVRDNSDGAGAMDDGDGDVRGGRDDDDDDDDGDGDGGIRDVRVGGCRGGNGRRDSDVHSDNSDAVDGTREYGVDKRVESGGEADKNRTTSTTTGGFKTIPRGKGIDGLGVPFRAIPSPARLPGLGTAASERQAQPIPRRSNMRTNESHGEGNEAMTFDGDGAAVQAVRDNSDGAGAMDDGDGDVRGGRDDDGDGVAIFRDESDEMKDDPDTTGCSTFGVRNTGKRCCRKKSREKGIDGLGVPFQWHTRPAQRLVPRTQAPNPGPRLNAVRRSVSYQTRSDSSSSGVARLVTRFMDSALFIIGDASDVAKLWADHIDGGDQSADRFYKKLVAPSHTNSPYIVDVASVLRGALQKVVGRGDLPAALCDAIVPGVPENAPSVIRTSTGGSLRAATLVHLDPPIGGGSGPSSGQHSSRIVSHDFMENIARSTARGGSIIVHAAWGDAYDNYRAALESVAIQRRKKFEECEKADRGWKEGQTYDTTFMRLTIDDFPVVRTYPGPRNNIAGNAFDGSPVNTVYPICVASLEGRTRCPPQTSYQCTGPARFGPDCGFSNVINVSARATIESGNALPRIGLTTLCPEEMEAGEVAEILHLFTPVFANRDESADDREGNFLALDLFAGSCAFAMGALGNRDYAGVVSVDNDEESICAGALRALRRYATFCVQGRGNISMSLAERETVLELLSVLAYSIPVDKDSEVPMALHLGDFGRGDGALPVFPQRVPHKAWATLCGLHNDSRSCVPHPTPIPEMKLNSITPRISRVAPPSSRTRVAEAFAAVGEAAKDPDSVMWSTALKADAFYLGFRVTENWLLCNYEESSRHCGIRARVSFEKGSVMAWFGGTILPRDFSANCFDELRAHGGVAIPRICEERNSKVRMRASPIVHPGGHVVIVPSPACAAGMLATGPVENANAVLLTPMAEFVADVTVAACLSGIKKKSWSREQKEYMFCHLNRTSAYRGSYGEATLTRAAIIAELEEISHPSALDVAHFETMERFMESSGFPLDLCSIEAIGAYPRLALYYAVSDPWACMLRAVKEVQPNDEISFKYGPDLSLYPVDLALHSPGDKCWSCRDSCLEIGVGSQFDDDDDDGDGEVTVSDMNH
jgi:hypothetical protein